MGGSEWECEWGDSPPPLLSSLPSHGGGVGEWGSGEVGKWGSGGVGEWGSGGVRASQQALNPKALIGGPKPKPETLDPKLTALNRTP